MAIPNIGANTVANTTLAASASSLCKTTGTASSTLRAGTSNIGSATTITITTMITSPK